MSNIQTSYKTKSVKLIGEANREMLDDLYGSLGTKKRKWCMYVCMYIIDKSREKTRNLAKLGVLRMKTVSKKSGMKRFWMDGETFF